MSFRLNHKSFLDPKVCYEMWARERISIYQIAKKLAEQGVVNPRTGKKVTPQGVWRAAHLYMLEHPGIAKSDTVALCKVTGEIYNDEQFHIELLSKAQQFLYQKKYKKFLEDNPEFKKYVVQS